MDSNALFSYQRDGGYDPSEVDSFIESLRAEYSRIVTLSEETNRQLGKFYEEYDKLKTESEMLKSYMTELTAERDTFRRGQAEAETLLNIAKNDNSAVISEKLALAGEADAAKAEAEALKIDNASLRTQVSVLDAENLRLKAGLAASEQADKGLERDVEALKAEADGLRAEAEDMKSEIEELKKANAKIDGENAELYNNCIELTNYIKELEEAKAQAEAQAALHTPAPAPILTSAPEPEAPAVTCQPPAQEPWRDPQAALDSFDADDIIAFKRPNELAELPNADDLIAFNRAGENFEFIKPEERFDPGFAGQIDLPPQLDPPPQFAPQADAVDTAFTDFDEQADDLSKGLAGILDRLNNVG